MPTTQHLPPRLRSYGITPDDLAAATPAALHETRADLTTAINRGATGDTLTIHRHNLAAINAELARRAGAAKRPASTGYGSDRHDPDTCGVCATIPAYLVDRHR